MQYIQQTEDARARLTRRDECRPETRDIPIPEPADPKCPGPQIFISDGDQKKGSLPNTPRPFVSIGGTLVITYSHCVSPEWLCKRGFVPPKKNSLTGAD